MILLDDLKEEDRSESNKRSGSGSKSKSSIVTETSQSFVSHVTGKKPSPDEASNQDSPLKKEEGK